MKRQKSKQLNGTANKRQKLFDNHTLNVNKMEYEYNPTKQYICDIHGNDQNVCNIYDCNGSYTKQKSINQCKTNVFDYEISYIV